MRPARRRFNVPAAFFCAIARTDANTRRASGVLRAYSAVAALPIRDEVRKRAAERACAFGKRRADQKARTQFAKLEKTPRTCAGALPYARASERTRLRFSARPVQTRARHPPGKKALRRKAPWRGLHAWRDSILRLCDGETTHGARAARMATPGGSDRMRARARFFVTASPWPCLSCPGRGGGRALCGPPP